MHISQKYGRSFAMDDLQFARISIACPLQYEVFSDGIQVGYLRLRHGRWSVEYVPPDPAREWEDLYYEAIDSGDSSRSLMGAFDDDEQAGKYLAHAAQLLRERMASEE